MWEDLGNYQVIPPNGCATSNRCPHHPYINLRNQVETISREDFEAFVRVRPWGMVLPAGTGTQSSEGVPMAYIANITLGTDLAAGGKTEQEAKDRLFDHINKANQPPNRSRE